MAWIYRISSGGIYTVQQAQSDNPQALGFGYSGAAGVPQNNPKYCQVKNVGPIPPGWYTIQAPRDTAEHGPYVLPLTPAETNTMYGRAGFLIHGDSKTAPGTASKGCIILARAIRTAIWCSEDHQLRVI